MEAMLSRADGRWVLRFERVLPHGCEKVWRALTDPSELSHWFPANVEGARRTGAVLRFLDRDGGDTTHGHVTALRSKEVFEYTWVDALLRWELGPEGEGCRLVFTHSFYDSATAARDAAGWESSLDRLGRWLLGAPVAFDPARWENALERYVNALTLMAGPQQGA